MASGSIRSDRLLAHQVTAVEADQDGVGLHVTRDFRDGIAVVSGIIRNTSSRPAHLKRCTIGLQRLESIWPDDAVVRGLRIAYCGAHSRSTLSRSHVMTLDQPTPVTSWWVG